MLYDSLELEFVIDAEDSSTSAIMTETFPKLSPGLMINYHRNKIQDTRCLFPNPITCILLGIHLCTEYYYDYNGNGGSTIAYIGCLPCAPWKSNMLD